jgi:hypothetical protein
MLLDMWSELERVEPIVGTSNQSVVISIYYEDGLVSFLGELIVIFVIYGRSIRFYGTSLAPCKEQ